MSKCKYAGYCKRASYEHWSYVIDNSITVRKAYASVASPPIHTVQDIYDTIDVAIEGLSNLEKVMLGVPIL